MGNIDTVRLYSFTATSTILLMIYTAILIRVIKGSMFTFVIKMIVLLMLYNIGVLAHEWLVKTLIHMLDN